MQVREHLISKLDTAEDFAGTDAPLGNAIGDIDAASFEHGDPLAIDYVQAAHRQGRNRGYKNR